MSVVIAPIVEGHGDEAAIRVLIQKLSPGVQVARPVRFPRTRLVKPDELARAAAIARSNLKSRGGLLLVMDADEDCAARLGPTLLGVLRQSAGVHLPFVALAVREFESWIVGGDAGYAEEFPEGAGGAKDRIRSRLGRYRESVDQPKQTDRIDVERLEARSPSFRRLTAFVRRVGSLDERA